MKNKNRIIKFRGKDIETNEWVYGYYRCENNDTHIISNDTNSEYLSTYNKIIPETLGQYTGLKDKNGTEIYEGDRVNDGIIVVYGNWNCGCCSNVYGYDFDDYSECQFEITGNIYEEENDVR